MRFRAAITGFLLLSGCASEPMTDEQRHFAMQYLLAQTNHPPPQPYVLPMPAPIQPQPRTCQSTVNGQIINTTCY